jgi:putative 4-mercaptohistidine N1-methyltranferase
MNPYETQRLVDEYLLFHFGSDEEVMPWNFGPKEALGFPVRTVGHFSEGLLDWALDLGCAVGRSAFELSRNCANVVAIDFSAAFVEMGKRMARGETVSYRRHEEAHRQSDLEARLPQGVHPERVHFEVGDAMDLRADLGEFNRVHAANLLCRLPEPARLVERLPSLVKPGGELVLATPCTWLADYTPPENWPKGSTFDWLQEQLAPDFDLLDTADEPFLIRETARKFQWTVSQVSKWRRR